MQANDRKASSRNRPDGRIQRIGLRVRELSMLAKAAAVMVASVVILLTMAFGSGRVRVSTEGVELQPREAVGAVRDDHSKRSIASPSGHGSVFLILAPGTVRICGPRPTP